MRFSAAIFLLCPPVYIDKILLSRNQGFLSRLSSARRARCSSQLSPREGGVVSRSVRISFQRFAGNDAADQIGFSDLLRSGCTGVTLLRSVLSVPFSTVYPKLLWFCSWSISSIGSSARHTWTLKRKHAAIFYQISPAGRAFQGQQLRFE